MGETSRLSRAGPNRRKGGEPYQQQWHQTLLGISHAFSPLHPTSERKLRPRDMWQIVMGRAGTEPSLASLAAPATALPATPLPLPR